VVEFQGAVDTRDERDGIERRYRFRADGHLVDVLLPQAAATVWRQAHPGADDAALDRWALDEARRRLKERLAEDPSNPGELLLDSGLSDGDEPPRYGEDGQPHR
jgi:hypothetical protein